MGAGRKPKSLAQHMLQGTYRPDRQRPSWKPTPVCNWRPWPSDLEGLSDTALAFVARARAQYAFNDPAGELILASADAIDELAILREAIRTEGQQIAGSHGRPKINPKVRQVRRLERLLAQVVNHFGLTL